MFQGRLDSDRCMIHLFNPTKTRQDILIIVFLENTGLSDKTTVSQIMISSLYIKVDLTADAYSPYVRGDSAVFPVKESKNQYSPYTRG